MFHKRLAIRFVVSLVLLAAINGCTSADKSRVILNSECQPAPRNDAVCNVVMGSSANKAAAGKVGVTISGGGEPGLPNQITGDYGTIGGGVDNLAGDRATVAGGSHNSAIAFRGTVGGGSNNNASAAYTTIAGGTNNTASFFEATISGGANNTASARDATVGGGSGNIASFTLATVSGGSYNTASSLQATVGGGSHNTASGAYAVVSGGSGNYADGFNTAVGGGSGNVASGDNATVSGGLANRATDDYNLVAGGYENVAGNANDDPRDAHYAAVGGGSHNTASGAFSTIPGGSSNSAAGDYSFATGHRARIDAAHPGSFLFADSNDTDFNSSAPNEFAVRATGGVRFVTAIESGGGPIAGVRLPKGSGSWESLSDRNAKENVVPVDSREIVKQLARLPISTWNYRTQDPSIRHIGPMAQDFRIFGAGVDDQYISVADANGVALAASQGLYELIQEQDSQLAEQQQEIATLKRENAAQQARIDALEARLTALEQQTMHSSAQVQSDFSNMSSIWLVLVGLCVTP